MAKFLDQAGVVYLLDRIHDIMTGIQVGDVDLTDYVKKEELQAELDKLDIDIDLSDYMTTQEISNALAKKANAIHTHSEYLTQHQDLSAYAKKTDMPTVPENVSSFANDANYATTSYVDNAISYVESDVYYGSEEPTDGSLIWLKPDGEVDVYATISYVDESISNIDTSNVNLEGYAKTADVNSALANKANIEHTHDEYLTEHQDISGKADKVHTHVMADITDYTAPTVDLTGYATETYVQEQIDAIEVTGGGVGASSTGTQAEIFNDYSNNTAEGTYAHAEGSKTIAKGYAAHAEGLDTTAEGAWAHAEGNNTDATGYAAHSEGYFTSALKNYSHAEGQFTVVNGVAGHAEGVYTKASSNCQHVQGQYNIEDTEGKYAHIVGNGTSNASSNAHTLDWNGNAWFAGKVYIGGTSMDDATELGAGGSVDLSNYYNKEEINSLIPTNEDIGTLIDTKLGVIENGSY